jgi:hypothetical protein
MPRAPKKQQAKPMAELARRIAARWGGAGGEVALDRLASELGDEQRYDIVASLKELEKAGAGTFEVGRAGRKARFLWSGKKLAFEKGVSKARPPKRALAPAATQASTGGELEHRFHLRPGFVVSVGLPADVTSSEVTRFCQFLQALPFENER